MKRNKMLDCPGWKNKPRTRTINLYLIASSFAASSNYTSSTKNFFSSKGDEGAQRNLVPAPLFGRASIRSIRLKGSSNSGQLPGLDETVETSLLEPGLMDGRSGWVA